MKSNSYSIATNFGENTAPKVKSFVPGQYKIIMLNQSIPGYSRAKSFTIIRPN